MRWFKKRQEETSPAAVQLRSGERHPFGMLENYVPLSRGETRLYRAVREAVPVVDAAVYKLIRMTGGVTARCGDRTAERALEEFLRTVPVGRGQFGVNAFLDGYLDSLLTCGRAVGEIVPAQGGGEHLEEQLQVLQRLRQEQGVFGRALLVDCGLNEDGRKLAELLVSKHRWVSLCEKDEIGRYLDG